jgi:hypothetical protein
MKRKSELERFACRVERHIKASGDQESMARLICRLMTNPKEPKVAAMLAAKWVDWRYGKNPDLTQLNLNVGFTIINRIERPERAANRDIPALPEATTVPQVPGEV